MTTTFSRALTSLRLLRWLGPWADSARAPRTQLTEVPGPPRHVHVAPPAGAKRTGSVLLIPGMHFLGPDDPRFRRFAAVLAASGAEVTAPHLADLLALELVPRMLVDAEAALVHASDRAGRPVGVMSISFGSIVALHLAATYPERVARVVTFGGYRRIEVALRFALGGEIEGFAANLRDPLNGPAVLANFADELLPEADRPALRAAALAFSRRTWTSGGGADDKHDGRHLRVGAEIAASLGGEVQRLFRIGCRLDGEPLAVIDQVIGGAAARIAFLDPTPLLPRVRVPVTCVHGRDDDVIPWTESDQLARELPHGKALITGLYSHTGNAALRPAAIVRELRAMAGVIGALAALPA